MPSAQTVYFTGPRELDVRVEGVSEPGQDEVLVRAEVSAVSPGTELLVYRGDAPTELATDATIDALSGSLAFPLKYGYATAGSVVSTGGNVSDDWIGESVFAFHPHASHFLASPSDLVRIPDGVTLAEAVFLPTVETAVNFVLDGTPRIGEQAVVFGQGLVGLVTTGLLADCPLSDLVTVDCYPQRRELAEAIGADCSLDATGDVCEKIDAELSRPKTPAGADLTYELSGNPSALDDAIAVTGYDGRILVGSWYGEKRADINLGGGFHRSRIDIESTQVSTISPELRGRWDADRRLAVAWRRLSNLDVTSLVTHRISIGNAHNAYRLLDERPNEAVGVLLTYD
ncbi:2-desacetyl-2-hydroxyethyl bacteriochlorophyllide A dehydrogenase [Haladaptatus litoreus]|uniref:2-desacetyl-2-hydroxyethyl bacteriochlorophyllide A dehydrogenase n=1 Tax=Haladaptatus litoreus TaxID=553468 RepID=A0A1N7E6B4_9EURY|nr:zinc-binding alcohol dehydrogenase [Haladaptatus litoreus]SIR83683.1 2-desacetyl-2-hydroxyethyl bacteriochlorophyllide A dehydrogenase [Haladaptatus litoreus]